MKDNFPLSNYDEDDEFRIESAAIKIHCPKCQNELVHDGNTLTLAESRTGAMFQCGCCREITQWKFTLEPFTLEQVPITWGGTV